ncbi:hypothetical protein DR999_PMT22946 [Platysternon megacephalum]|uniref:Uncharacterized protein n=1 Tax=Platysternon megacephalum TaxID=55544 RepID=A0A4D9DDV3_9SAUR|nr:hypothetical protein DR999_PMT22946 [Platysternon megacephalum]
MAALLAQSSYLTRSAALQAPGILTLAHGFNAASISYLVTAIYNAPACPLHPSKILALVPQARAISLPRSPLHYRGLSHLQPRTPPLSSVSPLCTQAQPHDLGLQAPPTDLAPPTISQAPPPRSRPRPLALQAPPLGSP